MPSGSALLPLPPRSAFEQDRTRRHRDDADLILRQLLRQRLGQADLRGLDGVVGHAAARLAAEDRRDDHDRAAALLAHVRHGEARHANRGKQRLVERLLPVGIGRRFDVGALRQADVVDEHVDAAERRVSAVSITTCDAGLGRHVGDDASPRRAPAPQPTAMQFGRRCLSASAPRAQMTTCAPSAIERRAAPRPSPRLPPVTIATFPC